MSRSVALIALLVTFSLTVFGRDIYHPGARESLGVLNAEEADPGFWSREAAAGIAAQLRAAAAAGAQGPARNVVLFLGDGMSLATLAAARAHLGQRENRSGEEATLAFEKFPTVGLTKTYCVDAQIADSACTSTAYLCGVKANSGTLGVTSSVPRHHCSAATDATHHVPSIAAWALEDGRDAGIVTTTRVTHASPAGAFSHSANRDWESDADVAVTCGDDARQDDIALQLITTYPGNQFKVILGGGRREFLPNTTIDEEGSPGRRLDGRNLIAEWEASQQSLGRQPLYAWHRSELLAATRAPPDSLLGLFESNHMQYHMDANPETEPTLAELTEAAIRVLSKNPRGFFLFVEGGRIDHAHHENRPRLALDETIELSAAVARATELLPESDSLLLVTSDHAHVMTLNGYARRGSDVLGPSDDVDSAGVPYMTLSYANGPGFRPHAEHGMRDDITGYNYADSEFLYEAGAPLDSETHGGEDVAIFARGPHHALFTGLFEQSAVPRRAAYAACFGPPPHAPACRLNILQVILGGGRREFLPNTTIDEEGSPGRRLDGRNLIAEWEASQQSLGRQPLYAWHRSELLAATRAPPDSLLGLFESNHMQYHMDANPETEPTLAELTEAAIRVLSKNPRGFFLFVEGGRIDHAHHENRPRLALDETIELSAAVARATELLPESDSLLLVTSDHAHVMTLNGYARRGSDVLGPSDDVDSAGVPYMTLSYANGPGFRPHAEHGMRDDITGYNYADSEFLYEAGAPLDSETHGGEDVAIFARGPHHALFTGLFEQSAVPRRAAYAACFGPPPHAPACRR